MYGWVGGPTLKSNAMKILGIDPGTTDSAAVILNTDNLAIVRHAILGNEELLLQLVGIDEALGLLKSEIVTVIEWLQYYGPTMHAGSETFETAYWCGRFAQASPGLVVRIKRPKVKLLLCGTPTAKDSQVSQAIRDRYGIEKSITVGTKRKPGPLYGIKSHEWSALSVALAYYDQWKYGVARTDDAGIML